MSTQKKCLLILDPNTVSFIYGVVLARIFKRKNFNIEVWHGDRTKNTTMFWNTTILGIEAGKYDTIILCGITFDTVFNPKACAHTLKALKKNCSELLIVSYRYPKDGYTEYKFDVKVPPFFIQNDYHDLQLGEIELLNLALIDNRLAQPIFIKPVEIEFVNKLSYLIYREQIKWWKLFLEGDIHEVIRKAEDSPVPAHNKDYIFPINDPSPFISREDEKYLLLNANILPAGHMPKSMQEVYRSKYKGSIFPDQHQDQSRGEVVLPPQKLCLAISEFPKNKIHAHIVNPWPAQVEKPSIEWLVEKFSNEIFSIQKEKWQGQQDAMFLSSTQLSLSANDFLDRIVKMANNYSMDIGERRPSPGLAWIVHSAAKKALEDIDLLGSYTKNNKLAFNIFKSRIYFHRSNRTNEVQRTFILCLEIHSPEAAAFLFSDNGYNIMKLERLLEGVLIGLKAQSSSWLGSIEIPGRLRIDPEFVGNIDLTKTAKNNAFFELNSIKPIRRDNTNIVTSQSAITKGLEKYKRNNLIIYRGSETIGPSVQYAEACGVLAQAIQRVKKKNLIVLDLFSGSGLPAISMIRHGVIEKAETVHVFCVDNCITARHNNLQKDKAITWLKADATETTSGEKGILDKKFDLICIDPPFNSLFEMLTKKNKKNWSLIESVFRMSPWVIIYVGHTTQSGRKTILQNVLKEHCKMLSMWNIEAEVIAIATREEDISSKEIMNDTYRELIQTCGPEGLYKWRIQPIEYIT